MARPHAVTALERKYARLLGCQQRLSHLAPSLADDLAYIEAVMRWFDPTWDKPAVRPVVPSMPSRWRKKGAGKLTAVEVMKQTGSPLTTKEIAVQALDL